MPMITRRGVGLAAAAVAVFFVASATRVGWLHLADAFLWAVLAFSFAFSWLTTAGLRGSRRVRVTSRGPRAVAPVEGETVDVEATVENPGVWPRYLVAARSESSIGPTVATRHRFFFAEIAARSARSVVQRVEVPMRGRHRFGPLVLESAGPFGLFRRTRRFHAPLSLLVYPRWVPMHRVGLLDVAEGASEGRNRSRVGGEVAGSRRYVFGDPLRLMHWRNTARTGRLAVKEFDAWAGNAVLLALDVDGVQGEAGESTLDYAARIAGSVSRALTATGAEVGLLTGAGRVEPGGDWRRFMRRLALLRPAPGRSLSAALRQVQPGTRVLAVVWSRDAAAVAALSALCRRGCTVAAAVLEGFAPGDDAAGALTALRRAGAAAVVCRRGALEDAVLAMERAHGGQARATPEPVSVDVLIDTDLAA